MNNSAPQENQSVASTQRDVNFDFIRSELQWVSIRVNKLLNSIINPEERFAEDPLYVVHGDSYYEKFLLKWNADELERMAIGICFAHLYFPTAFDCFLRVFGKGETRHSNVGGIFKESSVRFYPTVRTLAWIMSGNNPATYARYLNQLSSSHRLFKEGILLVKENPDETSFVEMEVKLNEIYFPTLLEGEDPRLDAESGFPASRNHGKHNMHDVVLDETTRREMEEIYLFAKQINRLCALPDKHMYKAYCVCVFTGEPGTGKSYSATAMGNELNMPVYTVNTAQLVSKYIGETEKNLERVLNRFNNKNCILFFDEAEAIFSKRTEVNDSHDRYANQEQSFLLQKMTEFNGVIILATNVQDIRQHMDKAFLRRFYRIINIPFPNYPERKLIWEKTLGSSFTYEQGLSDRMARDYQLSGGSIHNVVSDGVIKALSINSKEIRFEMMERALMSEFNKTGRKYEVVPDELVHVNPARRFGAGYEKRSMIS